MNTDDPEACVQSPHISTRLPGKDGLAGLVGSREVTAESHDRMPLEGQASA